MFGTKLYLRWTVLSIIFLMCSASCNAKLSNNGNKTNIDMRTFHKVQSGNGILLADELKQTLERYLFGMCPQTFKMSFLNKNKNNTINACDIDSDQNDLAGRLASLALRAHSASRGECSYLGTALSNTFSELARTAANRQTNSGSNEANKKRKLSKSQKAKIQAKQRTALAVKKKAAAVAAAAAAKMAAATTSI